MSEDWLQACQAALNYQFHDPQLLKTALTHSSKRSHPTDSNERLEFLGDAILGFLVSEYLFKHYPRSTEGDLTAIKSIVVSRRTLAEVSRRIRLPEFLRVGKGVAEKKALPLSVLGNALEAVIGAIYLDGGIEAARAFIMAHLTGEIAKVERGQHEVNYKSLLQQYAQRELGGTPTYRVVAEEGPAHVKSFRVVAVINEKEYATASGRSKKEAEQRAAELTLRGLMENGRTDHHTAVHESDVGAESDDEEREVSLLPLPPAPGLDSPE